MKKGDQVEYIKTENAVLYGCKFTVTEVDDSDGMVKFKETSSWYNQSDFKVIRKKPEENKNPTTGIPSGIGKPKQEIDYFLSYRGKGNPIEPVYIESKMEDEAVKPEKPFTRPWDRSTTQNKLYEIETRLRNQFRESQIPDLIFRQLVIQEYGKECVLATIEKLKEKSMFQTDFDYEDHDKKVSWSELINPENIVLL